MLTLKDVRAADQALFFNVEEFAESVTLNGKSCTVVMKPETLKTMKLKMGEGLRKAELMFEVRMHELPGKPKTGGIMSFNGVKYRVTSCSLTAFTYEIILEVHS